MVTLPNTIANNDPLDAAPVMANFNALAAAQDDITNAQIAEAAGIAPTKLSHPQHTWMVAVPVLPFSADPALTGVAFGTIPTSWTTLAAFRVKLRSGQVAWLCSAEFDVRDAAAAGGSSPELQILHSSVVVGGSGVTISTTPAYYTIENANPIDNPLRPVADGDVIEVQIRQSGSSTPTIRGVMLNLWFKESPVP